MGREFSFLKVSNPRVRVMALKKAEQSDEVICGWWNSMANLSRNVRVSFAAPITAAREVNGQEQPVGRQAWPTAHWSHPLALISPAHFALTTRPCARPQSRAFVQRRSRCSMTSRLPPTTASSLEGGFDGKGDALPGGDAARRNHVQRCAVHLASAKTGVPNAVIAKGQTIDFPPDDYNRLYVLAASADGDQKATFTVGYKPVDLNIEDWGGFIGQWDDRQWTGKSLDVDHAHYAQMTGSSRATSSAPAWRGIVRITTTRQGKNAPTLTRICLAYPIDLPAGAKTIKLPQNDKIRILAISVADESPRIEACSASLRHIGPVGTSFCRRYALA